MTPLSSVDRALDVLFHLHRSRNACGVSDIGRALGLPKSSIHRLLQALSRRSLVEQDAQGRYRLGVGLMALGLGALESEPIVAAARSVLESESAALGETVFLVAARAGQLVVLDKVEGTGLLRASPRVGATVPVNATAVGKLYLAHAAHQVQAGALIAHTKRTAVSEASLKREVERCRRRGYGTNDEEWIEGLSVVAAPIVPHEELVGTLAIAVATPRMKALGVEQIGQRCVAAAARVADALRGVAG